MKNNKIKPCVFRGDKEDEYCVSCNGVTMLIDNDEEVSCELCGGYAPDNKDIEVENNKSTKNVNEVEDIPDTTLSDNAQSSEINLNPPTNTITQKQSKIEIQAESGVSFEVKNNGSSTWYKLGYTEKRIVDETNIENEREALWDTVNSEVDNQVQAVLQVNNK